MHILYTTSFISQCSGWNIYVREAMFVL